MGSTPRCSTATTSVAWHREAEAGTPPQAAGSLAGVVCVMEMAVRQSYSLIMNSNRRTAWCRRQGRRRRWRGRRRRGADDDEDDGEVVAGVVQTRGLDEEDGGASEETMKTMARSSPAWCKPVGSTRKTEAQARLPRGVLLFRQRPGQVEAVDVDDEQEAPRRCLVPHR